MAMQTETNAIRRRFTADERRAMAKAGIIALDGGIELRGGELFYKNSGVRRRFTVDEYYAMAEAGILSPDERVELLAGEIIEMAAMGSRHAACVAGFEELLHETLGRRASIRVQTPLRLSGEYEPEPDIAVLRRRDDFYAAGHPGPADALLVIEVSDSTLGSDRRRKLPIYATYGIPEVWLADLTMRRVEAHAEPYAGGYARVAVIGVGGSLAPAAFPDIAIPVAAAMPR